jgi:hypothetical protein
MNRLMKLLLKVLIGGAVLLTVAFAQEPKRAVVAQDPVSPLTASTTQLIATADPQRPAPKIEPKALPPMNPSLGEIARQARAAHAAAAKAQVVIADDAPPKE